MTGRSTRSSLSRMPGPAFVSAQNNQYSSNQNNRMNMGTPGQNRMNPNPYNRMPDNNTSMNSPNQGNAANRGNNMTRMPEAVKQENKPMVVPVQETSSNQPMTESEQEENEKAGKKRFPWKRSGAITKVSKSAKRVRQNKRLRKLLTPKNALMVLNELQGQNAPEYKLGQALVLPYMGGNQYKAEVVINGSTYQGQGISKILAKNNAAEKAIRDLVLERMRNEKQKVAGAEDGEDVVMAEPDDDTNASESQIPMVHLASYALHKLFTEWQAEGFDIPLLTKNMSASTLSLTEAGKVEGTPTPPKPHKIKTELPANAATMHPAMLLAQMRPGCAYTDLGMESVENSNQKIFTVGVVIDGQQFSGSAKNKKEARRLAAQNACSTTFGIKYPEPENGSQISSVV